MIVLVPRGVCLYLRVGPTLTEVKPLRMDSPWLPLLPTCFIALLMAAPDASGKRKVR